MDRAKRIDSSLLSVVPFLSRIRRFISLDIRYLGTRSIPPPFLYILSLRHSYLSVPFSSLTFSSSVSGLFRILTPLGFILTGNFAKGWKDTELARDLLVTSNWIFPICQLFGISCSEYPSIGVEVGLIRRHVLDRPLSETNRSCIVNY